MPPSFARHASSLLRLFVAPAQLRVALLPSGLMFARCYTPACSRTSSTAQPPAYASGPCHASNAVYIHAHANIASVKPAFSTVKPPASASLLRL